MNDFLSMVRYHESEKIPVWFMRQAGRYMKSYNEIKKNLSIRDICMDPDITERITYSPVDLLGVDAAIIFADIILPLEAMNYDIDFSNTGPVIYNGYQKNRDLKNIIEFDEKNLKYKTADAIKLFKERHKDVPLIGFSGGIITVLSYVLSGSSDNNLTYTKSVILRDKKFRLYKELIKDMIIKYLKMQINAGVDAVQIFDSWLGSLSPYIFEKNLKSDIFDIINEIKSNIPIIYFATGNSGMIGEFNDINPDFLSVDWRIKINDARVMLRNTIGIQGNLDPYVVQYDENAAIEETNYILNSMKSHDNYIFNLGHGVLPDTQESTLKRIVSFVHDYKNK
ncbi:MULTISPECIES: uroporphyrinogen decarboxylase [Acidiplasma]|jgi:uroporphyrinogen decarboxylase|uniref:Uroporphyrinogen decarboxylase n=2 Tax=Acidiplasma TaxID=507753 RepID=A0A0Q0VQZ3_9ARCH|nr:MULTISPECIES: uroporphyrinogen decarboxylase [Acidiplasma]KJE49759.1 uroporphyrinogen decarboxylase [Acidiplasma sp. MBA-1]KQB33542.1 uroporphyrinogen decarboxylase [Acidiplasma cupricumulans]WMT55715.1 MAG: uroporphyrinogen decarboxylase [Acidiplasma sp.]